MVAEILQARENLKQDIDEHGFGILHGVFSQQGVDYLLTEMASLEKRPAPEKPQNLLRMSPMVASVANHPALVPVIRDILGSKARPFTAFFLDKTPDSNWQIPWHQNLRLPVAASAQGTVPEIAHGVPQIIADAAYLDEVLIARISLDDQTAENGALEFIPGTHRTGILLPEALEQITQTKSVLSPDLAVGSIFLFKALLLHRSRPSQNDAHRRVLQIEYSANCAPAGFSWYGL
jgi:ectoine hydroxylase-related dioxygenase (phytanoyl-CoA dioxygenase family)